MKISEILTKARTVLKESGVKNVGLDSIILLSHALSFSKEQIIFNPDLQIGEKEKTKFFELLLRRSKREPISHIIENREFFGKNFFVNSSVLDPRPDSEVLIELIFALFPNHSQNLEILEIGVGSACLITTALNHFIDSTGIGLDISKKALEVAQINIKNHQLESRLKLIQSDLFSELKNGEKFDLIISNPPYIPSSDIKKLQEEVREFEPIIALDGGIDGLDFYRKISEEARYFLKKDGKIVLEIGQNQGEPIREIFLEKDFQLIATKHDLSGIERSLAFASKC